MMTLNKIVYNNNFSAILTCWYWLDTITTSWLSSALTVCIHLASLTTSRVRSTQSVPSTHLSLVTIKIQSLSCSIVTDWECHLMMLGWRSDLSNLLGLIWTQHGQLPLHWLPNLPSRYLSSYRGFIERQRVSHLDVQCLPDRQNRLLFIHLLLIYILTCSCPPTYKVGITRSE